MFERHTFDDPEATQLEIDNSLRLVEEMDSRFLQNSYLLFRVSLIILRAAITPNMGVPTRPKLRAHGDKHPVLKSASSIHLDVRTPSTEQSER